MKEEEICHMRKRIHVICGGGYMSYAARKHVI
jgi:hypothetical protein